MKFKDLFEGDGEPRPQKWTADDGTEYRSKRAGTSLYKIERKVSGKWTHANYPMVLNTPPKESDYQRVHGKGEK